MSFPVMAQEALDAKQSPESKSSMNGLSIPEPIEIDGSRARTDARSAEAQNSHTALLLVRFNPD